MAYSALAVANWFIQKGNLSNDQISHMKLQKLVFYAHGWYLANFGKPLIKESFNAWDFGPVVERLYHTFKRYGSRKIIQKEQVFDIESKSENFLSTPIVDNPADIDLLEAVWSVYGTHSAFVLSDMTHADGEPWQIARKEGASIIPNELIQRIFESKKVKEEP